MTGVNTVIRGAIVPLKFEVFAGNTELKSPSTVVASLTSTKVDCSTGDKLGDEPQPLTPQSGTSLRYNTITGQFIFYWRTPYQSNTCYDIQLTTKDGSSIVAHFKLSSIRNGEKKRDRFTYTLFSFLVLLLISIHIIIPLYFFVKSIIP